MAPHYPSHTSHNGVVDLGSLSTHRFTLRDNFEALKTAANPKPSAVMISSSEVMAANTGQSTQAWFEGWDCGWELDLELELMNF